VKSDYDYFDPTGKNQQLFAWWRSSQAAVLPRV
jgi:hypothetical protein